MPGAHCRPRPRYACIMRKMIAVVALLAIGCGDGGDSQPPPDNAPVPIDAPDPFHDVVQCDELSWGQSGECEKACVQRPPGVPPSDPATCCVPLPGTSTIVECPGDSRKDLLGRFGCCQTTGVAPLKVFFNECIEPRGQPCS